MSLFDVEDMMRDEVENMIRSEEPACMKENYMKLLDFGIKPNMAINILSDTYTEVINMILIYCMGGCLAGWTGKNIRRRWN